VVTRIFGAHAIGCIPTVACVHSTVLNREKDRLHRARVSDPHCFNPDPDQIPDLGF
jgi:hypothetical protein